MCAASRYEKSGAAYYAKRRVLHFMLRRYIIMLGVGYFRWQEGRTWHFCSVHAADFASLQHREKKRRKTTSHLQRTLLNDILRLCAFALTCSAARSNKKSASDIISTSLRLNVNTNMYIYMRRPQRVWHYLHFPFAYYAPVWQLCSMQSLICSWVFLITVSCCVLANKYVCDDLPCRLPEWFWIRCAIRCLIPVCATTFWFYNPRFGFHSGQLIPREEISHLNRPTN